MHVAEFHNRERDYPEVKASPQAKVLCLDVEISGRWNDHYLYFLKQINSSKSNNIAPILQHHINWIFLIHGETSYGMQRIIATSILRHNGFDFNESGDSFMMLPASDMLDLHR